MAFFFFLRKKMNEHMKIWYLLSGNKQKAQTSLARAFTAC